jgi:hypothetical protein
MRLCDQFDVRRRRVLQRASANDARVLAQALVALRQAHARGQTA